MVHVSFPDERYNTPKLITRRGGVWDAPRVNDNRFCGATVNGAAVRRSYLTYTHVNN